MRIILDIIAHLERDLDDPEWIERAHVAAHRIADRFKEIKQTDDTTVYLREEEVHARFADLIKDYCQRRRNFG